MLGANKGNQCVLLHLNVQFFRSTVECNVVFYETVIFRLLPIFLGWDNVLAHDNSSAYGCTLVHGLTNSWDSTWRGNPHVPLRMQHCSKMCCLVLWMMPCVTSLSLVWKRKRGVS